MDYKAARSYILRRLRRELSPDLTYHGLHHTLDVLHTTEELCRIEKIPSYEALLVKTAALFHDSGFLISSKDHEHHSCEIVAEVLPRFGYQSKEIRRIQEMIMATKIPQQPKTYLAKLLCDADLDYLGRDDFYSIGNTLFQELKAQNLLQGERAWNRLQVNFLENHQFFTPTNKKRRSPKKQKHLQELKELVNNSKKN